MVYDRSFNLVKLQTLSQALDVNHYEVGPYLKTRDITMEGPWNFIATALFINFLFVRVVTKIVTKPTGIKLVDDTILYLNTQDSFLLNSSLVLALVIFLADYWLAPESSSVTESMSPDV
jgi:hypothetical protein